jgi:hypothetical protein
MHVMGFLYVTLGSSTVQLRDSLGNRRACECSEVRFNDQNGDRAREMYYRRPEFYCAFFVGKGLYAKDINKEMFTVLYFSILLHFYYTIYINPYIKFLI